MDHVLHDPQVPVTLLDLTEPQHQRILKDLLHSRPPDYIHLGMPCGTASRARERPVAKSKVLQGAPQPPPLRSADHPLGLPHINPESTSGIRLKKANQLYSFVIDILLIAMKYDIAISLENPYRSWFWAAILALVQAQNNPALTRFWDSLTEVFFHNCCHGGQRKKGTRWKSTPGVFHGLSATCQNDHDHLPYQVHTENGTWTFDTASEAAYPELLTQRVADAIRKFLSPKGFSFAPPPNPRLTSLAMQHRQHKKRGQLIPDFVHLHWFPPNHKLQDLQKILPSSNQGEYQEEVQLPHSAKDILVGTWHTPEEFVKKAQKVVHPMDECALNKITKDAIEFVSMSDPKLVSIERRKNLLKAKILPKQLEGDEKSLHKSLPESVEKVVSDKKILLWQTLLERNGYDDMEVVKFMKYGVPLVGTHDHPPCYPLKPKLASLTEAELRSSAIPWAPDGCTGFC